MRDVSHKSSSLREASATATLLVSPATIRLVRDGDCPKGDPFPVARVAAIQAAKATAQLIPYCHPVPVDWVEIEFAVLEESIECTATVRAVYRTGVEMEALTAASVAALNLFDCLKPVDSDMAISSVRLLGKSGGKSDAEGSGKFLATVIVVSDSVARGESEDASGRLLVERLTGLGGEVAGPNVVPDEIEEIQQALRRIEGGRLVLLTGGTGAGPRDTTPEAVLPLLSRRLPGVEHRLHAFGQERFPSAMLGRPTAGIIGENIVIAIPGSPSAARDAVDALFPYLLHTFPVMKGEKHGG